MAGTAAGRYSQLEGDRRSYLDRARKCAKLTIPSLMPDEGASSSTVFVTPYQSVGARGVNNLASKLLLTLFPPNTTYFKMKVDEMTLGQITGKAGMQAEVDKALSAYTQKVMSEVEQRSVRVSAFEAFKQLINAGNALLYIPETGGVRVYRLDKYVCKRDPAGTLLELVIKEQIALAAIPEDVKKMLPIQAASPASAGTGKDGVVTPSAETLKPHDLYTHCFLEGEEYWCYQEIEGVVVPGSIGKYPKDKSPFMPLRMVKVDGEDYGRSYVEEYLGDLSVLEDLTKALVEFSAIASRVNFFVRPNGSTRIKDVSEAKNGDFIVGNALEDITTLQVDKPNDFSVVKAMINEIEGRLAFAFLLNTAIQRPGERVTAEEISYMARELEDTLGGVYSVQSQELQLPLTFVLISQLERTGKLPTLPAGILPTIVTGMDALGRGQDLAKLDGFISGALQKNPQVVAQYINWSDYLTRRGAALGIDMNGLIKTADEVAAENQRAMMMQMAEKLGPQAIAAGGGLAQKAMDGQAAPPAPAQ